MRFLWANGYGHFQTSQFQILYFRHSLKAFYFLKCDSHFIQGWPSHSRFWTRAASRLFCFQAQSRCLVDSKKLIRIRRRNTWRIHSPSKLWLAENCPGKYFQNKMKPHFPLWQATVTKKGFCPSTAHLHKVSTTLSKVAKLFRLTMPLKIVWKTVHHWCWIRQAYTSFFVGKGGCLWDFRNFNLDQLLEVADWLCFVLLIIYSI